MKIEYLWYITAGIAVGFLSVPLFNRVPAAWLCDYGETPPPELSEKRISAAPHGILIAAVLGTAFLLLAVQYGINAVSALLALASIPLVLASVSDGKYQILPDQCLPAILIPALVIYLLDFTGRIRFYDSYASPFLGAVFGGGFWLLIGLLGRALYHRESIGFGDVKFSAAVGFLCGFPGAVYAFLLMILLAGTIFLVLILLHRVDPQKYMPMGPYICAGCLLELAFSRQIAAFADWYLSIITGGVL
jgi:prepilin signal peptidase PulO-like enzyme (type II secretory pathway)